MRNKVMRKWIVINFLIPYSSFLIPYFLSQPDPNSSLISDLYKFLLQQE